MWTLLRRRFSTSCTALLKANRLPPRPKIDDADILEKFLKGGGKGGQKINKTNSKVQLTHIPTGIVVESQFSRSRDDNRKRARTILAQKVDELVNGESSRSAIVGNYLAQKARKKKQRARSRQRKRLEEEGQGQEQEQEQEQELESGVEKDASLGSVEQKS